MEFLFGQSPIQKRVSQATDELRLVPDWGANLELCDVANRSAESAQEVVNAVKKRMLNKKQKVALLSLTLLEALVKNGRSHVHDLVARKAFLDELVKASRSLDYETRDKALELIMGWADAFKDKGPNYQTFFLIYQTLQSEGVDFPVRDTNDSVPVFTPAAHPPPEPEAGSDKPAVDYHQVTEEYLAKIKKDLEVVINFLGITREMLTAVSDPESARKDDTLVALVRNLKQIQSRFLVLIVEVNHEPLVDLIIQLNEHVFHCLEWHKNACEGVPYDAPEINSDELLESVLEISLLQTAEQTLKAAQEKKERDEEVKEENDDDEFAAIAQRNMMKEEEEESESEPNKTQDVDSLLDDIQIGDEPARKQSGDSLEDLLNLDLGDDDDDTQKQLPSSTAQLDLELLDFDAEHEEEAESAARRRGYS